MSEAFTAGVNELCIRDSYNLGLYANNLLILFEFAAVIVCHRNCLLYTSVFVQLYLWSMALQYFLCFSIQCFVHVFQCVIYDLNVCFFLCLLCLLDISCHKLLKINLYNE